MNTDMEQANASMPTSALPHVQEVLRTAERELSGLLQQRSDLMKRIGTIKQMLSGMANHFGTAILNEELQVALDNGRTSDRRKGLTRACRDILMESRTPVPARQGREELRRKIPELAGRHKDLTASVTTVFHRLVAYGEARSYLNETGTRVWEWIAEPATRRDQDPPVNLGVAGQTGPPQPAFPPRRLYPD